MEVHPAAQIFPMLPEAELSALSEDIKQNGLIHPIVLDAEGLLLDGRNRLAACELAKVEPKTVTYRGLDPLHYVVSANLARRHLNETQRAMIASRLAKLPVGSNQHASIEAPSQDDAADLMRVSRSSVQRAAVVQA